MIRFIYVTEWNGSNMKTSSQRNALTKISTVAMTKRSAGLPACLVDLACSVLSLSRLSPWRRFLPRLTWTALLRFVLIFPYVVVGSTLPTSRSTPAWFCTSCCHFNGCFCFLLCLRSVCSVASHIQCLLHWLLCRTPFTRITLLNMAFSKAVLNMAFSKTLVYTHVFVQT